MEKRIQPFVDGDKEGFKKEIQREADRLASTPFGVPLMHIIACVPLSKMQKIHHDGSCLSRLCQPVENMTLRVMLHLLNLDLMLCGRGNDICYGRQQ